ncbi:MAG: SpoIID/LytB domain protein, partial [[Eubacterium] saphenum]|nr:SpoIID/LytB domain protein [[Eubacterium] saphenum]
ITGRVFREKIMSFDIRSNAFDIDYNPSTDEFTFTTYGYGHGVGLSQNGANNLAKYWGWDYRQILEFYYTGTYVA